MKSEEENQLEFEKMLKAAKTLKSDLLEKKANLEEQIAARNQDKSDETDALNENQADLKREKDYEKEITPDCDWIIGAFTKRAEHRTAELNGLTSAKEFLAGKQASSLIEKKQTGFDDQ